MNNGEFLQLAYNFNEAKHCVAGWYVSEKLDGMRAYWDGGLTRGKLTSEVFFANTEKDWRRLTPPRSTGLWSRYSKPIAAPEWFLNALPEGVPLDGELYAGRGNFQKLISTVKKFDPVDSEWLDIKYMIFDAPSDEAMFQARRINNPNCKLILTGSDLNRHPKMMFQQTLNYLEKLDISNGISEVHEQLLLPATTNEALMAIDVYLDAITLRGGEGLVLRRPGSTWTPKRTADLLKVKKWHDSEGTVIGWNYGVGKLSGLMGSLQIAWKGNTFNLSGFTDEERELTGDVPKYFKKGTVVKFKYRELTKDGIPKEARYFRKIYNSEGM